MRIILNQAVKDARLLWKLLAAWLFVLIACHLFFFYVVPGGVPDRETQSRISAIQTGLAILGTAAFIVITGLLVQADSPASSSAFWLTRPISRRSMLAAKLLLACAALVVCPAALDALGVVAAGVGVTWLPPSVPFQLAWMLPLMAVAALTTDLSRLLLFTVFEVVLFVGLAGLANQLHVDITLRHVNMTAVAWLIAALGGVLVATAYLTRRIMTCGVLLGLAPAVLLGLMLVWPWPHVPGPDYPESKRATISVGADRESLELDSRFGTRAIHVPLTIGGVPAGAQMVIADPRGWIQIGVDRVGFDRVRGATEWPLYVLARQRRPPPEPASQETRRVMTRALAGTTLLLPSPLQEPEQGVIIFLREGEFTRLAGKTGSLHVEFELVAYEYRVAATLPVAPDLGFSAAGMHATLLAVRPGSGDLSIVTRETGVGWNLGYWWSDPRLLRNRRLGRSILGVASGTASLDAALFTRALPLPQSLVTAWRTLTFDLRTPETFPVASWLDGAELVVVSRQRVGRFTAAVDIPGVDLARLPAVTASSR